MNAAESYLRDALPLLIERGKDASQRRNEMRSKGDPEGAAFESGRAVAYYEIVSTLIGQLAVFGIPREAVGVAAEFDPDRELA